MRYTYILCMQDKEARSNDRMVRKQVLLSRALNERLGAASVATVRSEGDLVREALEQWLARRRSGRDDWKQGLLSVAGLWADSGPSDQELAANRRGRAKRRTQMLARMGAKD